MNEQLRELFKKAFNEGAMYEATLSKAYSFDSFIEDNIEQLRLYRVSNSIATEYAEFCVRCDREGLPLLCLEDYIKQYCC